MANAQLREPAAGIAAAPVLVGFAVLWIGLLGYGVWVTYLHGRV